VCVGCLPGVVARLCTDMGMRLYADVVAQLCTYMGDIGCVLCSTWCY
jgi:hypothetical protein